jgi:hypothetical protein
MSVRTPAARRPRVVAPWIAEYVRLVEAGDAGDHRVLCADALLGLPCMCTLHAQLRPRGARQMCTLPLLAGGNVSAAFASV